MEQLYESVVAMQEGVVVAPCHESPYPPEPIFITAGGNVTHFGYQPALPYNVKECGMPLDSLAALEVYFEDLARDDNEHAITTKFFVHLYASPPVYFWPATPFGLFDFEQGWDDESDWGQQSLSNLRSGPQVDPQVFVSKLEEVDIATIAPEDMKCSYFWDDFGHAEDETIQLRNADVKADNAPVKMPCGSGHLIGKTCLMQLIDSGIRLCPMWSVDIVALVD